MIIMYILLAVMVINAIRLHVQASVLNGIADMYEAENVKTLHLLAIDRAILENRQFSHYLPF